MSLPGIFDEIIIIKLFLFKLFYNCSLIKLMKSVSIIYKRPTKGHHQNEEGQKKQFRRYVDQYFTKITNKNNEKDEKQQSLRSKTATMKFNRLHKPFDSLNIITLKNPNLGLNNKISSQKVFKKTMQFNIPKTRRNSSQFALKLNEQHENMIQRKGTSKREASRPKDIIKHSRVIVIGKLKCPKDFTLIISADFIINQFSFWGEQYIEMNSLKGWKKLAPHANIVWLVRRHSTAMKIQEFAQNWNLNLNGILQIEPNKKQPLTISLNNFEQQAKLRIDNKLVFIGSLRVKSLDEEQKIRHFQFKNSLPIVNHKLFLVHFIKMDNLTEKNRFNNILKVVSTRYLPPKLQMQSIFAQYRQFKMKPISIFDNNFNKAYNVAEKSLENLEKIKASLYAYFDQVIGLNSKVQGDSMYYLIGDMIKRNFGIAKQIYKYQFNYEARLDTKTVRNNSLTVDSSEMGTTQPNIFQTIRKKVEYHQSVHIWNF